jgi:hypothetical protein
MSSKVVAAVLAGLILTGWSAGAGVAGAFPIPTPTPSPAPSPLPGPVPLPSPAAATSSPTTPPLPGPPQPKTIIDHDGIFAVGTDIVPGIYSSAGPVANGTCYWKRMGNPDGALIDNSISKKPQVVQIDANDKAFKTTGCQPWQLTPDATLPPQIPGPLAGAQLSILNGLLGGNGQPAPQSGPGPTSQPAPQPGPGPTGQPVPQP